MVNYLILQHPGHNRVFYIAAEQLAFAELAIASKRLEANCNNIAIKVIKGIRYLSFETNEILSKTDFEVISRLSFVFAIFTLDKNGDTEMLTPIEKHSYEFVDDKVSSLLKYPGKTNELFTKMMVNVGLLSSEFGYGDNIELLDPVAGRGTTLFEALVYGYHAFGIEVDAKSTHEVNVFFKKYLENERYKHQVQKRMIYGKSKTDAVYINEFEFARTKEEFKDSKQHKKIGVITGYTQDTDKFFNPNRFHLIVGDLPYGIAHGNKTGSQKSNTRNPFELLNLCLPAWKTVLKKGGVVVIAWNSFVVTRHKLAKAFTENGFEVLTGEPYANFEHMVDKSIKRDIIVAAT